MPVHSGNINVQLVNLGAGEVILDLHEEDVLSPDVRIQGPATPSAPNIRLLDNIASVRPGYNAVGTAPDTNPVTGLYTAIFDDGTSATLRVTKDKVYKLAGTAYTDITGAVTLSGSDTDFPSFASVRRPGTVNPKNQIFIANGKSATLTKWVGSGNCAAVTGSPAKAQLVVGFQGRAYAMNCNDGSGNRKRTRIQRSAVADPDDWTGTGSGFVDLDEDAYPIKQCAIMGGGQVILKGDKDGGSVWRGTPTGLVDQPIRYDPMNPDSGIGILAWRTFILVTPSLAFFLGHDGFYLYDGVKGFKRVAPKLTRTILSTINPDALEAAHAWYKKATGEIHIAIPTGDYDYPEQTWVYNLVEDRVYGPYSYAHRLTASCMHSASGALDWDTGMDYAGGWGTLPWSSWNLIGGQAESPTLLYGTSDGLCVRDEDDPADDDNGTTVTGSYETGVIHAEGRRTFDPKTGQQRILDENDMLTLHDVGIRYRSTDSWQPGVAVSVDGGDTVQQIDTGETIAAGSGILAVHNLSPAPLTGRTFQIRVAASTMHLHSIFLRFTYGGSYRHG